MRTYAAFYLALSSLLLASAARADRQWRRNGHDANVATSNRSGKRHDQQGSLERATRRNGSYGSVEDGSVQRQAYTPGWSRTSLNARGSIVKRDLQFITDMAATDPVGAAKAVQQIPYLANNASGVTDTADVSVLRFVSVGGAEWLTFLLI